MCVVQGLGDLQTSLWIFLITYVPLTMPMVSLVWWSKYGSKMHTGETVSILSLTAEKTQVASTSLVTSHAQLNTAALHRYN